MTVYDRKPNCSYNCLIGMALKSSASGRLPVGEIYRFFEREFPYFLSAAEPWKNSLRHSLSLGHYFRKYNSDKLVTKKGHLWEVNPQRTAELDKEMYMFLARGLPDNVPSSPQLSKLRLLMTQLLLDSIKNTPSSSGSSNLHHHRRHHSSVYPLGPPQQQVQPVLSTSMNYPPATLQAVPQGIPIQQPGATDNIVMLAPPGALFSSEAQRSMMYSSPTTAAGMERYSRRQSMGSLFPSTPGRDRGQPTNMSPQLPLTPLSISSVSEALVPSPFAGFNHHDCLERAGTESANTGEMCQEAYQLVHFCNQCSFDWDDISQQQPWSPAAIQADRTPMTTPRHSKRRIAPQLYDLDHSFTCQQAETACMTETGYQDAYYPFLTPPTTESDVVLSQFNGFHDYCLDPGPPAELIVTKCKPRQRNISEQRCREFELGRDLDMAVRPFMYDLNTYMEMEQIFSMLSEEFVVNFMACKNDRDIRRFLIGRPQKVLDFVIPYEKPKPKPVAKPAPETPKRRSQYRSRRRYSLVKKFPRRNLSSATKKCAPKKCNSKTKNSSGKTDQPNSEPSAPETMPEAEPLELIVSIPFRKLITERQMKKYCGRGKYTLK